MPELAPVMKTILSLRDVVMGPPAPKFTMEFGDAEIGDTIPIQENWVMSPNSAPRVTDFHGHVTDFRP